MSWMWEFFDKTDIVSAIIGAVATLLAAALPILVKLRGTEKQLGDQTEVLTKAIMDQPEGTNVRVVRQQMIVDFRESGEHSVTRKELIRHIPGQPPVNSKKIGWIIDDIDGYLKKHGKKITEIDLDKEFYITVMDVRNRVFLPAKTILETEPTGYQKLSTLLGFDTLSEKNPELEYQIKYDKLDASFSFKTLWDTRNDIWISRSREPLEDLNVQLFFPTNLPRNKWKQHAQLEPKPDNWATVNSDIHDGKIRATITAKNLQPEIEYMVRLDFRPDVAAR